MDPTAEELVESLDEADARRFIERAEKNDAQFTVVRLTDSNDARGIRLIAHLVGAHANRFDAAWIVVETVGIAMADAEAVASIVRSAVRPDPDVAAREFAIDNRQIVVVAVRGSHADRPYRVFLDHAYQYIPDHDVPMPSPVAMDGSETPHNYALASMRSIRSGRPELVILIMPDPVYPRLNPTEISIHDITKLVTETMATSIAHRNFFRTSSVGDLVDSADEERYIYGQYDKLGERWSVRVHMTGAVVRVLDMTRLLAHEPGFTGKWFEEEARAMIEFTTRVFTRFGIVFKRMLVFAAMFDVADIPLVDMSTSGRTFRRLSSPHSEIFIPSGAGLAILPAIGRQTRQEAVRLRQRLEDHYGAEQHA